MSEKNFGDLAVELVSWAKEKKVVLRIFGSAAVWLHCPKYSHLREKFGREVQDVDFVSYGKYASKISELFEEHGFSEDVTLSAFGGGRLLFQDKKTGAHSDVFLDRLKMNHEINFSKRIEHDYPTIPLAELLLSKLQIVKINEKDIMDAIVLLREHDLGDDDGDKINLVQVSEILSRDWGFYHTVDINLGKIGASLSAYSVLLSEDRQDISSKIKTLRTSIESKPKSLAWKIRSRSGESIKWYEEVEEVYR
jgi:hypothetical protein